jgi:proline iminopeptidase
MDPAFMERMSTLFPDGHYLFCPDGGHMALYDDQATYMAGLIDFLDEVSR